VGYTASTPLWYRERREKKKGRIVELNECVEV
jgi:hypothetical protein